jgi:hypothetical protein
MRKVLLVLTVLAMTAPCWAAVSVSCSYVGETVTVSYNCTGDANDIRAFGIQIDVNNGAYISNIDVNDAEYYIFPGSIDINGLGGVEDWGSAVVDYNSNPNGGFTLEMGSLYDPCDPVHKTVPPKSGTLCTFEVATPLTGCCVSLSRDTARGGVVMEDGSDYATLSGCCMPYGGPYPADAPDWSMWNDVGRPACWANPRHCHGDADGLKQGNVWTGEWYVGTDDLNVLAAAWQVAEPTFGPGIATVTGPKGELGICADFAHNKQGNQWTGEWHVGTDDLNAMAVYWQVKEPTIGPGTPADCFD